MSGNDYKHPCGLEDPGPQWMMVPADKVTGILHLHTACSASELQAILNYVADKLPGLGVDADVEDPALTAAAMKLRGWLDNDFVSMTNQEVEALWALVEAHLPEEEATDDS